MTSQLGNKDLILEIDSIIVLNFITSNTVILRTLASGVLNAKYLFSTPKTHIKCFSNVK